jgi:hypothetical protein
MLGYLGATTGFVIYRMGNAVAYGMAALFALIGYVGLGICSSYTSASEWLFFFTLVFLIIAAVSSGIAIVAAICTPVENFTRRGSILMIILMMGYFLIGYMFEYSIRWGLFPKTRSSWYFSIFGICVALVYGLCAGLIQETRSRFQDAVISIDQMGSFIFILVELALVSCLYFFFLRYHWYVWTFVAFCIVFLINFILVGVMITMSASKVEDIEIRGSGLGESDMGIRRELDDYIFTPKLYCMLFASLCLVGVTSVFLYRFDTFLVFVKARGANLYTYYGTIVITQVLAAILVGLISYFTRNSINEYLFPVIGAILAIIGLVLYIISYYSTNLTFAGTILISIAGGIGWVMFPLIAYDDAGPQPFGVILCLTFLANYWGMCTFGFTFFILFENLVKPVIPVLIIYIIGCVGAIIGSVAALTMDDKEMKYY